MCACVAVVACLSSSRGGESALSAGEGAVVSATCVQSGGVSVCASVNKTRHVCSAPFGHILGSC